METTCTHSETTIVVLQAFAMFEQIGFQCVECKEVIKTKNQ